MSSVFFIVGTGRCGTQMLRNVLNCWPNVVILPETHFIISLYDAYGLQDISSNDFLEVVDNIRGASDKKWSKVILNSSQRTYEGYQNEYINYINANKIKGNIRVFIDAFYDFLYGKGKVFGDKTPHYGTNFTIIKKIWPQAKAIHLVRDGVDCAHSMLGHPGFIRYIAEDISVKDLDRVMYKRPSYQPSSVKPSMEQAMAFWDSVIRETRHELHDIPNDDVLEVKYEDIVFTPAKEITAISHFLHIENDTHSLQKAITIPRPFPEKHQVKKLSEKNYQKYYSLTQEMMGFYGYPYTSVVTRNFYGVFKEIYRGRYSYLIQFKKTLIRLMKTAIGK